MTIIFYTDGPIVYRRHTKQQLSAFNKLRGYFIFNLNTICLCFSPVFYNSDVLWGWTTRTYIHDGVLFIYLFSIHKRHINVELLIYSDMAYFYVVLFVKQEAKMELKFKHGNVHVVLLNNALHSKSYKLSSFMYHLICCSGF